MVPSLLPVHAGTRLTATLVNPVFIADLHLSPFKRRTARAFFNFMKTTAPLYRELFILGDLFEFWLGDDAAWIAGPVTNALAAYSASGRKLYLMQGNRDELLGADYAAATGAVLLAPQTPVVTAAGTRILLSHGDEWCTLDPDYQAFRTMMRDPAWQTMALEKTFCGRIVYALKARRHSKTQKKVKTPEVMDVVENEVEASARHENCTYVIHGHTHKPANHTDLAVPRCVIPDWRLDGEANGRYGWVTVTEDGRPELIIRRTG